MKNKKFFGRPGLCGSSQRRHAREEEDWRDRARDRHRGGTAEMSGTQKLRIGFMPLVDAATLIVAVDMGFAKAEGLDIGFSPRGLLVQHSRQARHRSFRRRAFADADGDRFDAGSRAYQGAFRSACEPFHERQCDHPVAFLVRRTAASGGWQAREPRKQRESLGQAREAARGAGARALDLGMTFPFSTHNYQLRYWMAEGGIDPDRDLRLVVLPPPFMVESLREGHVHGFCVGAPWNSVAVDAGLGVILHFGCEIFPRAPEKVLALRESTVASDPQLATALVRAVVAAADFCCNAENRDAVASLLSREDRVAVDARLIAETLAGRLTIDARGNQRSAQEYLVIGRDSCRPSEYQAAWLYAQMLRWGQTQFSADHLSAAQAVMRTEFYDRAVGETSCRLAPIGGFAGPTFEKDDIASYLRAFPVGEKL